MLLLRVAVGVAMVVSAAAPLADRDEWSLRTWALCLPSIASGLALAVGLLTPAAAALAAALSLGSAAAPSAMGLRSVLAGGPALLFLTVMAIALMLLGPGGVLARRAPLRAPRDRGAAGPPPVVSGLTRRAAEGGLPPSC